MTTDMHSKALRGLFFIHNFKTVQGGNMYKISKYESD